LENKKWVRTGDWLNVEIEVLNKHYFLTSKQIVYLVNLSEEDFIRKKKNKWLVKIKEWIEANVPGEIIPYSAAYEAKLLEQEEE